MSPGRNGFGPLADAKVVARLKQKTLVNDPFGVYSIKLYGTVSYGFVIAAKFFFSKLLHKMGMGQWLWVMCSVTRKNRQISIKVA